MFRNRKVESFEADDFIAEQETFPRVLLQHRTNTKPTPNRLETFGSYNEVVQNIFPQFSFNLKHFLTQKRFLEYLATILW